MISRHDLTKKYGQSDRQVRRRLTTLGDLLDGHTARGENGRELYDDHVGNLYDRLIQLEADGRSTHPARPIVSEKNSQKRG